MEDDAYIRESVAWAIALTEEIVARYPALADQHHPGWLGAYVDQNGLHFPGADGAAAETA